MNSLFENPGIRFDNSNSITISKENLFLIIEKSKAFELFLDGDSVPQECYAILDKQHKDLYPFSMADLNEWERDGSCEKGDKLYRISFIKKY